MRFSDYCLDLFAARTWTTIAAILLCLCVQGAAGLSMQTAIATCRRWPDVHAILGVNARRVLVIMLFGTIPSAMGFGWMMAGAMKSVDHLMHSIVPLMLIAAAGIGLLTGGASVLSRHNPLSSRHVPTITCLWAVGGGVAVLGISTLNSFRVAPDDWAVDLHMFRALWSLPWITMGLEALASSLALGTAMFLVSAPEATRGDVFVASRSAAIGAYFASALLVMAAWWLPRNVGWEVAYGTLQPSGHVGLAIRAHAVAVVSWAIAGWMLWFPTDFLSRDPDFREAPEDAGSRPSARLLVASGVAVLAVAATAASAEALQGPWLIRGMVYVNGVSATQARTMRRSPIGTDVDGPKVFQLRCQPCHAPGEEVSIPSATTTREFLEQLRQADQPGHPYRGSMPPLVGSDADVDRLADWLDHGRK